MMMSGGQTRMSSSKPFFMNALWFLKCVVSQAQASPSWPAPQACSALQASIWPAQAEQEQQEQEQAWPTLTLVIKARPSRFWSSLRSQFWSHEWWLCLPFSNVKNVPSEQSNVKTFDQILNWSRVTLIFFKEPNLFHNASNSSQLIVEVVLVDEIVHVHGPHRIITERADRG